VIGRRGRSHHLGEERLLDCYVSDRSGERIDPRAAEHLTDCPECGRRYAEFAALMDNVRTDGRSETDEIFTPERLQAQRRQIGRRLQHVGRPARIISFPARMAARHGRGSGASGLRRWIYAAAAAGLAVGLGLGVVFQSAWLIPDRLQRAAAHGAVGGGFGPVATSGTTRPDAADDAFLSDLDIALEGPGTRALKPFDALTPHVREVRDTLR
jgi:anti-sigma factor RsiW